MKNPFLIKEIKSKDGVLHFRRWRILETRWFSIYIHGIYKKDEDLHCHDHPWNYSSFCISGSFWEKQIINGEEKFNLVDPGTFVSRKATGFHMIYALASKAVYTLFITGKRYRDWGYNVDGKWIDNATYRKLKNSGQL